MRSRFYEEYQESLFKSADGEDKSNDEIDNINKTLGWYFVLKTLSNDDITKIDKVLELDFQSVVNYLLIIKQEKRIEKIKKELENGKTTFG